MSTPPPPSGWGAPIPSPPSAATAPRPATSAGTGGASAAGVVVAVIGLGMTMIGLFALPLESIRFLDVGFLNYRQASALSDRFGDVYTRFWWRFGLLLAVAALVVAVAVLAAARPPARRAAGIVVAVIAGGTMVLHAIALWLSPSYRSVQTARSIGSLFDDAGAGIWVGMAGLVVLVVGGVIAAVSR